MRKLTPVHLILLAIIMIGGMRIGVDTHAQSDTSLPLESVVTGNTQFAFDLYHALRNAADNIIYSPYSISTALAMVYAGARENTALQMAETLHFDLHPDDLHPVFAALGEQLTSIDNDYEDAFQLNIANAVWAQDGYPLQPDYTVLLNEHYGAGVQSVDFANAAEDARVTINDWVSQKTDGRIPELLSPASLSPVSRLVLTNAIYFNATWQLLFDEDETYEEAFTLLDGTDVQVPMMHMSNQFGYIEGDKFQVIELDYQPQGEVKMMIILPDSGAFDAVEEALDADWFRQTREELAAWQTTWNVNLSMPRFGTEMTVELSETLTEMGMPDAFQISANFAGIADPAATGEPLFIDLVIHQAFIEVDEEGTEAAAATAIGLGGGGPPNEPFDFQVNRPFVYVVYHRQTGTILFVGRVLNPLEG